MSRQMNVVATLLPLQADVATAFDAVLMSRSLPDVVTSSRCRDIDVQSIVHLMSRLLFGVTTTLSTAHGFNSVATSCLFLHQFMVA